MKQHLSVFIKSSFLLSLLFVSCKHEIPDLLYTNPIISPTPTPIISSNCSPDTVYFNSEIEPLITSGCTTAGCHDAITRASGVNLLSYSNIVRYVSPGNFSSSKLYTVLVKSGGERMPIPPLPAFTSAQILKVQKWITQGAKNNACNACDSTNFKYSTAILPMLQSKCIGCHSAANAGGGIDLSTYALVKTVTVNGKLWGSINQDAGFSAMPKGIAKMSVCELTQFKKWIAAGALNN